jgi:hypothetical protein
MSEAGKLKLEWVRVELSDLNSDTENKPEHMYLFFFKRNMHSINLTT